jgi:hypothetical protein
MFGTECLEFSGIQGSTHDKLVTLLNPRLIRRMTAWPAAEINLLIIIMEYHGLEPSDAWEPLLYQVVIGYLASMTAAPRCQA